MVVMCIASGFLLLTLVGIGVGRARGVLAREAEPLVHRAVILLLIAVGVDGLFALSGSPAGVAATTMLATAFLIAGIWNLYLAVLGAPVRKAAVADTAAAARKFEIARGVEQRAAQRVEQGHVPQQQAAARSDCPACGAGNFPQPLTRCPSCGLRFLQ